MTMNSSHAARLPSLGLLLGPMLSADGGGRVHAKGSGTEAGHEHAEEYWRWGGGSRLSTEGRVVTSGPVATVARSRRRSVESKPGPMAWLGWTDRLLEPRNLYVWGRRGEDWRIDDVAGWSPVVKGAVEVRVLHLEDGRAGALHVIPDLGRVMRIELPGFLTWAIDEINDNPDVASWPLRRWFEDVIPERDTW
jgi:hypothetical protein